MVQLKQIQSRLINPLIFTDNRKGEVHIKSKRLSNQLNNKKEEKMARTKNRIKSMKFQRQDRNLQPLEPLSDNDKYIIEMSGYKKGLRTTHEKIPRYANSSG
jgi:hypothetical protein